MALFVVTEFYQDDNDVESGDGTDADDSYKDENNDGDAAADDDEGGGIANGGVWKRKVLHTFKKSASIFMHWVS